MKKMKDHFVLSRRDICVAFGAAGGAAMLPTGLRAANDKVLAATGIDPYFSVFPVGLDKGFFADNGIDFEIRPFDSGGAALDALVTNEAEIGSSAAITSMTRWDRGGRLYPVASMSASGDLYGVTVNGSIQEPEDFYGKTVAFPRLTSGHYFFEHFLNHYGLDPDKINIRTVPTAESVAALERGDIDAFFLWEPWNTRAATLVKGARTFAVSKDVGLDFVMYLYFSQGLVDSPDVAERALKAVMDTADWIEDHKDETASIIEAAYRLPHEDAVKQLSNLTFRVEMMKEPVMKDFISFAEFGVRQEMIKGVPDWDEFMRPEFMRAIAPERAKGW